MFILQKIGKGESITHVSPKVEKSESSYTIKIKWLNY
jgi:hypothetical protein